MLEALLSDLKNLALPALFSFAVAALYFLLLTAAVLLLATVFPAKNHRVEAKNRRDLEGM